jgi:ankyrin repeat protein
VELFLQAAVNDDSECLISDLIDAGVSIRNGALKIAIEQNKSKQLVLKTILATVIRGDPDIFKALIDLGISMNVQILDLANIGDTVAVISPLSIAILKEKYELVSFMLDYGVEVNYFEGGGNATSPLEAAIRMRKPTLVNTLLELGSNPQDDGALYSAIQNGREMIDILFPASFQAFSNRKCRIGVPALQIAIHQKNSDAIQLLLKNSVPVNELPQSVLVDAVGLRVEGRFRHETAVETAIIQDKSKSLDIFRQVMNALRDWNAPLVQRSGPKASPLLLAIKHVNPGAVDLILDRGADVNEARVRFGVETPLTAAIKSADLTLVEKLIKLGANLHAPATPSGRMTPLRCAAACGLIPIARLLLSLGVEIDAPGALYDGRTALEAAAENGRIDMIHLLVKAGAQITSTGRRQFERAKALAAENSHHAASMLLDTLHTDMASTISLNPGNSNPAPREPSRIPESQRDQAINDSFGEVDLHTWINMEMVEGVIPEPALSAGHLDF